MQVPSPGKALVGFARSPHAYASMTVQNPILAQNDIKYLVT